MDRRPNRNGRDVSVRHVFTPLGVVVFTFEEHVGFADGAGFGVDFLAVEVGDDLVVALICEAFGFLQRR